LCKKLVVYFFDLLHHKVKEEANINLSFCIKILFIILQSGWQFVPALPKLLLQPEGKTKVMLEERAAASDSH
jgi:hypothetical protein